MVIYGQKLSCGCIETKLENGEIIIEEFCEKHRKEYEKEIKKFIKESMKVRKLK